MLYQGGGIFREKNFRRPCVGISRRKFGLLEFPPDSTRNLKVGDTCFMQIGSSVEEIQSTKGWSAYRSMLEVVRPEFLMDRDMSERHQVAVQTLING